MAVGRRGGTELVLQGAGHDRVLVVAEQVLELLGLPARPPGRFAPLIWPGVTALALLFRPALHRARGAA